VLTVEGHAQVDPAKVLVEVWDGQAAVMGQSRFTLVINNVKETGDGTWVGRGRFGFASMTDTENRRGGNTELNITSKDGEILVSFITINAKTPINLKLIGENKLEGTIGVVQMGGSLRDRKIWFEKKP